MDVRVGPSDQAGGVEAVKPKLPTAQSARSDKTPVAVRGAAP